MNSRNVLVLTLTFLVFASESFAYDMRQFSRMKSTILKAKSVVQQAINARGARPHFYMSENAHITEEISASDIDSDTYIMEDDNAALIRLNESSTTLIAASDLALQAEMAWQSGNFNQFNYSYAFTCSKAAIASSQIARARLMAIRPPLGFLNAWASQLLDVVTELQQLRSDSICP
ncbi:MAG: hypothetical protein HQK53_15280 [Oligoflexia bacterium]|nr:hypothetical protein [Oligoflexia bacterium]